MQRSAIYAQCPKCRETTLIQELQGTYVCASCGFDYVAAYADDEAAREQWAVDTMRTGVSGQLAVVYLHRLITKLPNAESIARVKSIAARNGIELPTGAPMNPGKIAAIVIGLLVAIVVGAIAISRL
jgi:hypothetical protein